MSITTHPTLFVLQYGNIDMENDTYSCLVEAENLEAAIKNETEEFTKNAEDCDMENFRVYTDTNKHGETFVNLEDEHKRVTEWQRFTPARVANFK